MRPCLRKKKQQNCITGLTEIKVKNEGCWPRPNKKHPRIDSYVGYYSQYDVIVAESSEGNGGRDTTKSRYRGGSRGGGGEVGKEPEKGDKGGGVEERVEDEEEVEELGVGKGDGEGR